MSQIFNRSAKTNNDTNKTQNSEQRSQAYDDVQRVARRTPALFRTNAVPHIAMRALNYDDIQTGEMR